MYHRYQLSFVRVVAQKLVLLRSVLLLWISSCQKLRTLRAIISIHLYLYMCIVKLYILVH